MGEQEIISFEKKIKVKIIKVSDEPITRCNKQIEKNIKENRKVLQLSMQESNQDIICD